MARRIDTQKSKVYAAENSLPEKNVERFDWTETVAYVRKVEGSAWFRRHYPHRRPVVVKDGRGTRIARGGVYHLNLPKWSRVPLVILHEMAHSVTIKAATAEKDAERGGVHGWAFCENYLKLVRHFMGADVERRLKAAFRAKKVRFAEPYTRT